MRGFLAAFLLAMTAAVPGFSESGDPSGRPDQKGSAANEEKMARMREKMSQIQHQQLESLRQRDPEAYERQVQFLDRQEKIEKILARFRKKEIGEDEASAELRPLVKESVKPELEGLDERIAAFEKRLAWLRRLKKDPGALADQRIEEMLGKRRHELMGPLY